MKFGSTKGETRIATEVTEDAEFPVPSVISVA
jgi:hypothetical protein